MTITQQITAELSPSEVARIYLGDPDSKKRSPNSVWYCCPFHHEKAASMQVYNEAGRGFYCRGCNTGGTVVRFVELYFETDNLVLLCKGCHDLQHERVSELVKFMDKR